MAAPDPATDLREIRLQIDRLIALVQRLNDDNRSLRARHEQLLGERAQLIARSDQARARVEAMIARLKTLEPGL